MPNEVIFSSDCLQIKKSGMNLLIRRKNHVLGNLNITKGAIEWLPKNKQQGVKLTWEKFNEVMKGLEA